MIIAVIVLTIAMLADHFITAWIDKHCVYEERSPVTRFILEHLGLWMWLAIKVVLLAGSVARSYPTETYMAAGIFVLVTIWNGLQILKVTKWAK